MNFLWEGLNPIYLLPAITLVVYLHIVGLAANRKIGTTIPSILMGFISSLAISAPFIVPAHLGLINYSKTFFLLPNLIVITTTIVYLFKNKIPISFNKKTIIITVFLYLTALMYGDELPGTLHDYWLYGEWFSFGSHFNYGTVQHNRNYLYGLTVMYTWLGSYSGLVSGPSSQVPTLSLHMEWQTLGTLLWISINMQVLVRIVPKIKYRIVIPCIAISALMSTTFTLFGYGFYGSFSLYWIFFIIVTTKERVVKNTVILSIGFLFMVSSVIVVSPLIVSTVYLWKNNYLLLPMKYINKTHIIAPIAMALILLVNFKTYDEYEHYDLLYFIFRQFLVYISAFIILFYSSLKFKQVVFINAVLALIANMMLNFNWNIFITRKMPAAVMHRYLSFILAQERSSVLITIVTFPWAMHLLYEHYKTKKDLK